MDCSQIRDAFVAGVRLPEEPLEAHLASCAQCRTLFERNGELGRSLATQASETPLFSEDFFGQLEQRLTQESGPRAWLRSRPSRLRLMFVLLPLLLVLAAGGLLRLRLDFDQYPAQRVALLLCVYFIAIALSLSKELSESPRRNPLREHWGLLLFAFFVPVLAAFAPATDASRLAGSEGAVSCFGYGALLTAPIAALLWALDRNDRPSLRTVCLSAAALGLSANLLLELHCGNGNAQHVLLGHASLGLAWLVAWAVIRALSRA